MKTNISSKPVYFKALLWSTLLLIPAFFTAKAVLKNSGSGAVHSLKNQLPVFGEIAHFQLIERKGGKLGLSDLGGKVWVADFIFTHCAGPCPLMSSHMARLAKTFQEEPEARFVSFSVDPERDKPAVLSEYAARYGAEPNKWFFLTGEKAQIHTLTQQSFHLGISEVSPDEKIPPEELITHSTKFVLVDKKGRIRGYYDSQEGAQLDRLTNDIRTLLGES